MIDKQILCKCVAIMMALMLYVCSENGRGSEAILNNNMGPSLDHSYNVASTALIVIYYPHIPNSNKDGPCFGVLGYLLYIMSRYLQRSIKDSKTQTLQMIALFCVKMNEIPLQFMHS
jgi:hypothetical protein